MSLRFDAINHVSHERINNPEVHSQKITAIFGESVFNIKTAREYLSDEAYKSLINSIKGSKPHLIAIV